MNFIAYTARSQSAYTETLGQGRLTGPIFSAPGGAARLTIGADIRAESAATTVSSVTLHGNQAGNDAQPTSGGYESYEGYATLSLPLLKDQFLAQ